MSRKKKKGCNPLGTILILGGIFLVALVGSLFAGKLAIQNWIQGDGLQSVIQKKAESHLKAQVNIDDVQWNRKSAFVGKLTARGYEEAAFSKLNLDALRANIGIKDNAFDVSEISVSRVYGEFSNDRLQGKAAEPETIEVPEKSNLPGWLKGYIPQRTVIGEVEIGSATLEVKDDTGKTSMAIRETRASIQPDLNTGVVKIEANGGKIELAEPAPPINIRESSLRFQSPNLFINNASLEVYDGGHIAGLGEVSFGEVSTVDLDLKVSGIDIKKVVNDEWKGKVSGTVRGPVKVSGTTDHLVQKGTLHLENGVLEAIPILDKIGKYTKSKRFSRLVLNQAQADFVLDGEVLELRNIQLESDGLTRVEGVLDKEGEAISGVLQVGVTPGTLRWIPGAEKDVFTESRDGFVWTTMKLGGTTDQISEDLSARLMSAAAMDIVDKLPANLQNTLKGIIGGGTEVTPTDPASPADGKAVDPADQVKDLILDKVGDEVGDQGKKLLEGLGTLFGQ